MTTVTVWNGPDEALRALAAAIQRNCECMIVDGVPDRTCSAHRMLSDQRVMNHLAFVVANVKCYKQAEFDPAGEWF